MSESITLKIKPQKKKKEIEIYNLSIISRSILIPIINIGSNINDVLRDILAKEIEGKCIREGYIKKESVKILTCSNGIVEGENILFEVVFECKVCCPVEGMNISCIAKNITKAGIRAELGELHSPMIIFIARDHNYLKKEFSEVEEGNTINIRVIGQRFELNDTYVSVLGELIPINKENKKEKISNLKKSINDTKSNNDNDSDIS